MTEHKKKQIRQLESEGFEGVKGLIEEYQKHGYENMTQQDLQHIITDIEEVVDHYKKQIELLEAI